MKFEEHYSGENSKLLWARINAIKNVAFREHAYRKAVEIQNLEGELKKIIKISEEL